MAIIQGLFFFFWKELAKLEISSVLPYIAGGSRIDTNSFETSFLLSNQATVDNLAKPRETKVIIAGLFVIVQVRDYLNSHQWTQALWLIYMMG